MKRSDFIKQSLAIVAIGFSITSLTGSCYKSEDTPTPTPNPGSKDCLANGTSSSVGANHGHTLTVSQDDVKNGIEKSYSIKGNASHPHTVTVEASQFGELKNNSTISVVSTNNNGHSHIVTVSCAYPGLT